MKWLKDKDSVSQEELKKNRDNANDAANYAADYADVAVFVAAYNAAAAAYYAEWAAADAKWVGRYFKHTGEDKQAYINELEKQQ